MQGKVLQLDAKDNVLIALSDLRQGERISFGGDTYELAGDVAAKHKFAMRDLSPGDADSLVRLVRSQVDLSLERLLGDREP